MKNKVLGFIMAGLFSFCLVVSVKVKQADSVQEENTESYTYINKVETPLAIDDEFEIAIEKDVEEEVKTEEVSVEETEEIIVEEVVVEEPVYQEVYTEPVVEEVYYSNGSGLNPTSGVNYYNGWRETYYSSNVLYHYRTPEWTVDENGVYRDSEGYVVVASSSDGQGSVVETSFGLGKVYDSGCAYGTHDIYTNW